MLARYRDPLTGLRFGTADAFKALRAQASAAAALTEAYKPEDAAPSLTKLGSSELPSAPVPDASTTGDHTNLPQH
jgi:hypothetical protein